MFNRIIKFRGKTKDTNEWIYGSLVVRDAEEIGEPDTCFITTKEHPAGRYVHPDSVGQLTGMDLRCEKLEFAVIAGIDEAPPPFTTFTEDGEVIFSEIYEGDIVLHCPHYNNEGKVSFKDLIPCVVAFSDEGVLAFWEYNSKREEFEMIEEWSDGEIDTYIAMPSEYDVLVGNYFDNPQYAEKPEKWKRKGQ